MLLIAGMRQHLPRLERIVKGQDPALAGAVRSLREAPVPDGRMPLVIHAIRLAELAQALIDRVDAPVPSPRAAGPENPTAGQYARVLPDALTAPADDDRQMIGAAAAVASMSGGARTRVPQRRSAALEASALAGSLQGCGPPAA
ncbi:hypothetical protein [Streptomyces lavenduligriseus]|uniref:Uncharacterized protein n=1 Tax=Streptomyces lavenduligriseus TaxID=67315 RepID=A0ABT0P8L8_9ACTN|nr:hypothetical protein [Streptomyces lavenduligriseus]MCL3999238.1 hypothetical protein [Streptomyces lavenduligriseus]